MLDFLKMIFNREKLIIVMKYYVIKLAIENASLTGKLSRGDTITPLARKLVEMAKVHEAEMAKTRALQSEYEEAITKANTIIEYVTDLLKSNGVDVDNI